MPKSSSTCSAARALPSQSAADVSESVGAVAHRAARRALARTHLQGRQLECHRGVGGQARPESAELRFSRCKEGVRPQPRAARLRQPQRIRIGNHLVPSELLRRTGDRARAGINESNLVGLKNGSRLVEQREAENAGKLKALRAAGRIAIRLKERDEFKELKSIEDLQFSLTELSEKLSSEHLNKARKAGLLFTPSSRSHQSAASPPRAPTARGRLRTAGR